MTDASPEALVALVFAGALQAVGAVALIAAVHLAGVGRLRRNRLAGIRVRATLASDEAWLRAHRAATPIVWLTGTIGAIAAVVGLLFAGGGAVREAMALLVLGAIVLLVGALLGAWRGIAAVR